MTYEERIRETIDIPNEVIVHSDAITTLASSGFPALAAAFAAWETSYDRDMGTITAENEISKGEYDELQVELQAYLGIFPMEQRGLDHHIRRNNDDITVSLIWSH